MVFNLTRKIIRWSRWRQFRQLVISVRHQWWEVSFEIVINQCISWILLYFARNSEVRVKGWRDCVREILWKFSRKANIAAIKVAWIQGMFPSLRIYICALFLFRRIIEWKAFKVSSYRLSARSWVLIMWNPWVSCLCFTLGCTTCVVVGQNVRVLGQWREVMLRLTKKAFLESTVSIYFPDRK